MEAQDFVCVAQVLGAHGIRGGLLLRIFTEEPALLAQYNPLICRQAGLDRGLLTVQQLRLKTADTGVAHCPEIADRTLAESYRGCELWVPRDRLPQLDADTFFIIDLVGCQVQDTTGISLGVVRGVHNFSAGFLLEIDKPDKKSVMMPFNKEAVPHVDLDKKIVQVDRQIFDQFDI